jgi:hypothetical protein
MFLTNSRIVSMTYVALPAIDVGPPALKHPGEFPDLHLLMRLDLVILDQPMLGAPTE